MAEPRSFAPLHPAVALRVLDSMAEGVSVVDEQGLILYTNPAEDAMFGYGPGELAGRPVTVLNAYPPEENERIVQEVIGILRRAGCWNGEWHNRRKDGSQFRTRARITMLETDGARYWVCVQEDITLRHSTELLLRSREEQFRSLVEQASDGIFIADPEGRYIEVNSAACAMTGYSRDELLQLRVDQIVAPEQAPMLDETRADLSEGRVQVREWNLVRKDGHVIPTEVSTKYLSDGRWQAIVREITARKSVDEQIRTINSTLKTIIRASPLPILTFNLNGQITLWNPAAERLFGWSAEEVLGGTIPFVPPEYSNEHRAMRERDLAGEGFTGRIVRRRRKDGTPLDLSVSTAPLRDNQDRVTGIISLYLDVTEQKRAEAALLESEQRFRLTADTAPVMIWISGADSAFTWFNRAWLDYRGRPAEAECGAGWFDGVHPDDQEYTKRTFAESFSLKCSFQVEFRLLRADRQFHWVINSAVPRFDAGGGFVGFIGSAIDINDRKQAEQDREFALEALARSNEELRQFAYVASHDLQEPLRTITAYTQLLVRKLDRRIEPDVQQYADFIVDASRRMSELIHGLLAFSRVSSAGELAVTNVDCGECVRGAAANLQESLSAGGAELDIGDLPVIRGNPAQIGQLFQNLISNAVKYRRGDSVRVRVSAERRGGRWVFAVADDGIGIAPEYHDRIFGLFKRLHGPDLPGTGLGLAICKRIVENHNGRIWVQSQLSEGATFYFTLGF